jgi:hypothetical protein
MTPRWLRAPTPAEIAAFDGLHCAALYREAVRTGWRCPSCDRTAEECIRWSYIRGPYWREQYGDAHGMGFTISLVRHHCHSTGEHDRTRVGRFEPALLCGECNVADGAAKRRLKLPRNFSFSPDEIGQFVTCWPHSGKVAIDYAKAAAIAGRILARPKYETPSYDAIFDRYGLNPFLEDDRVEAARIWARGGAA